MEVISASFSSRSSLLKHHNASGVVLGTGKEDNQDSCFHEVHFTVTVMKFCVFIRVEDYLIAYQ